MGESMIFENEKEAEIESQPEGGLGLVMAPRARALPRQTDTACSRNRAQSPRRVGRRINEIYQILSQDFQKFESIFVIF